MSVICEVKPRGVSQVAYSRIALIYGNAVSLRVVAKHIAKVASTLGYIPVFFNYPIAPFEMENVAKRCIIVMPFSPTFSLTHVMFYRDYNLNGIRTIFYTTIEGKPKRTMIPHWVYRDLEVVVNSKYVKRKLEDIGIRVKGVVYHGVDLETVDRALSLKPVYEKFLKRKLKRKVVFFTAVHTHERKGLRELAGVIPLVEQKCKEVGFYILSSEEAKEIFKDCTSVYVDPRYGKLSYEEVLRFMVGADFVIHPALAEGFGLPVLESMACKTPVIHLAYDPLMEFTSVEGNFIVPTEGHHLLDLEEGILYEIHEYDPLIFADTILEAVDLYLKHRDEYFDKCEKVRKQAEKFDIYKVYKELLVMVGCIVPDTEESQTNHKAKEKILVEGG